MRQIKAGLRAGRDVIAVVRIDSDFADGLILLSNCRSAQSNSRPKTVAPRTVQVLPPSVDLRMPWLPIENDPKFRSPVPA